MLARASLSPLPTSSTSSRDMHAVSLSFRRGACCVRCAVAAVDVCAAPEASEAVLDAGALCGDAVPDVALALPWPLLEDENESDDDDEGEEEEEEEGVPRDLERWWLWRRWLLLEVPALAAWPAVASVIAAVATESAAEAKSSRAATQSATLTKTLSSGENA